MNFQVIKTKISRFAQTMVTYTALKENWEKIPERDKGLKV